MLTSVGCESCATPRCPGTANKNGPGCDAINSAELKLMPVRTTNRSVQAQIQKMVRRIVRQFHPERIILFGSQARGDAGPDSDVDLLVVMPVKGPKHKKEIEIRVALHHIRVSKDIIVTTPEDFAWRQHVVGTIEYPAVQEGKLLYSRS